MKLTIKSGFQFHQELVTFTPEGVVVSRRASRPTTWEGDVYGAEVVDVSPSAHYVLVDHHEHFSETNPPMGWSR